MLQTQVLHRNVGLQDTEATPKPDTRPCPHVLSGAECSPRISVSLILSSSQEYTLFDIDPGNELVRVDPKSNLWTPTFLGEEYVAGSWKDQAASLGLDADADSMEGPAREHNARRDLPTLLKSRTFPHLLFHPTSPSSLSQSTFFGIQVEREAKKRYGIDEDNGRDEVEPKYPYAHSKQERSGNPPLHQQLSSYFSSEAQAEAASLHPIRTKATVRNLMWEQKAIVMMGYCCQSVRSSR
ncbi:mrna-nucleus export-related protein [Moniliophthora roreri]|nr:mrna-nucleus export-related protein [Moniliophthora roreri]